MANKTNARTVQAIRLMLNQNMSAYAAAQQIGIAPITIYRSRLYKLHQDGDHAALNAELAELDKFHAAKKKAARAAARRAA